MSAVSFSSWSDLEILQISLFMAPRSKRNMQHFSGEPIGVLSYWKRGEPSANHFARLAWERRR